MIDRAAIERIDGVGGPVLVGKMIDLFLENAPQRVSAAQQGQADGDLKAVEAAVHSLKSSAGNLGAVRLQELAGRIEELAEKGAGDQIPELMEQLHDAWDEARSELEVERRGLAQ